jgi:TM2 domain-containing membrane protein YozV
MLLSILIPGAGQFYNGELGKGTLVLLTFWMVIPYIYGIVDAWRTAERINRYGY